MLFHWNAIFAHAYYYLSALVFILSWEEAPDTHQSDKTYVIYVHTSKRMPKKWHLGYSLCICQKFETQDPLDPMQCQKSRIQDPLNPTQNKMSGSKIPRIPRQGKIAGSKIPRIPRWSENQDPGSIRISRQNEHVGSKIPRIPRQNLKCWIQDPQDPTTKPEMLDPRSIKIPDLGSYGSWILDLFGILAQPWWWRSIGNTGPIQQLTTTAAQLIPFVVASHGVYVLPSTNTASQFGHQLRQRYCWAVLQGSGWKLVDCG